MLFNELHIRDFTTEELLQQVCLGNFELTPTVVESLVQYIMLFMNDYEELQAELDDVYENYVEKDEYKELQDELESAKFNADNLEGELEDANRKIESLTADIEDRDQLIMELFGVIKAHKLTGEIATWDKKYILDNVLRHNKL